MGLYYRNKRVIGVNSDGDINIGSGGASGSLNVYLWGSHKLAIKAINGVNHVIVVT